MEQISNKLQHTNTSELYSIYTYVENYSKTVKKKREREIMETNSSKLNHIIQNQLYTNQNIQIWQSTSILISSERPTVVLLGITCFAVV